METPLKKKDIHLPPPTTAKKKVEEKPPERKSLIFDEL